MNGPVPVASFGWFLIMENIKTAEAADRAFKARLYKSELERQVQMKYEAERKRREDEVLEEEKLLKKIHIQREKERKAYLQEMAAMDSQIKLKEESRKRQKIIAQRLEELQIEEARQRDAESAKKKKNFLELMYNRDFTEPRSSLSSYYFEMPWTRRETLSNWFRNWQLSLEEIYINAPIHQLIEISQKLEAEQGKIRQVMRQRIGNDT